MSDKDNRHRIQSEEVLRCIAICKARPSEVRISSTRGEVGILSALTASQTPLSPGELASQLNISTARVANTLRSLEKKGLIKRDINSADRRSVFVTITPAGKALVNDHHEQNILAVESILSLLGENEREQVTKLVSIINQRIIEHDSPKS